jgi:eukaryotic-like serine/threonine-protein kinase
MVAPGTPFGPYRIVALLGAGGMGEVYRAHDSRLGRDVALKILPAHLGADAAAVERLTREARAVAALSHPGILTIYDIGQDGGHVYLVTELLEGETLRRRLSRGPLPWPQALDVASAVASGLAAAHARGIVHRDLKPENIFVTSGGAAKILDFGVAKLVDPQMTGTRTSPAVVLTAPGAAVGTLAYMAPEQLEAREVDHRADQFAFGILLHELIGGHHPFRGDTAHEIAAAILRDTPAPLSTARPDTPPAFSRVVARCLARDPANRYASTTDLVLALDDVRADSDSDARTHSIAAAPANRRGSWWLTGSLAAAALVAVGAWVLQPRATAVPAAAAATVSAQSVAVLPFGTIGDGERYLADGVTEAVTRELGRVKTVRVIAANSAFAYRDRPDGDISHELGVALVVRGSVQHTGGRVRINSSLIDARQGTTLWSERYDRDAGNVLALQDEIAWQVAAHLAANVGSAPPERPSPSQSTTPAAYDAYLKGLSHMRGRSGVTSPGQRLAASIAEFERAVALDANFALGHAMLASAYTQRFFYDATVPADEQKAFLAIERALAINPDQAEAYLARGQIVWNVRNGFQHDRAIVDLRRAVANNPSLAEAYVELGKVYYHIGMTDESIAANDEALRLDPLATVAARRRFNALFDARRFDEVREILGRNPRWLAPSLRAEALLMMDEVPTALAALTAPAAGGGQDSGFRDMELNNLAVLAHAYAKAGRRDDAQRALAAVMPRAVNPTGLSDIHHAQFSIGCALALLGRHDDAFYWLEKAADEGYPSYPKFSGVADLAVLKAHAGFAGLLDRLRRDWERWRTTL